MTIVLPSSAPRFALIGAAGFVAPRHLAAMRALGGELVAACDPHDSVGVLDRYFPNASFYRDATQMLAALTGQRVDYVAICSPNDLHVDHVRQVLRSGMNAICEKPLALRSADALGLLALATERGMHVHPVLQLRHHPGLGSLRGELQILAASQTGPLEVRLCYVTARGPWYDVSWKGDPTRSGGLLTAIGIHFLDLLLWFFGPERHSRVLSATQHRVSGTSRLDRARVHWLLSTDERDLPSEAIQEGRRSFRRLTVAGRDLEFSDHFEDLHVASYRAILSGQGLGPLDTLPALAMCEALRAEPAQGAPTWPHREAP